MKQRKSHSVRRRKPRKLKMPVGAPPGTLTPIADMPPPAMRLIAYGPGGFEEQAILEPEAVAAARKRYPVVWLDVDGLGDLDMIRRVGQAFEIHPLALEDAIHVQQRAKVEDYATHHFVVARMPPTGGLPDTEQLSLVLGAGFVVTFQEGTPGDCFGAVRERIRNGVGRIRAAGPDYLAYSLLDAVVDAFFPVLEQLGEQFEALEEQIFERPLPGIFRQVHDLKQQLIVLRRVVWPMRDAIHSLIRDETPRISEETRLYLRDCYDHTVRLMELVETYRELGADLKDLYLSSVSQRMTEVMKVLTIIATIFIPLTFISSIYGMNFNPAASPWNMPELNWIWGYPFALTLMAATAIGMLVYFWRKGWMGSNGGDTRSGKPPDDAA